MSQNIKHTGSFMALITLYLLLAIIGCFSQITSVFFPIVALPLIIYCIRNKMTLREHSLFHMIVGLFILMDSSYGGSLLIYIMAVILPTYIILYLYSCEVKTPNIIMYVGISLSVVIFILSMVVKRTGIDIEMYYYKVIDEMGEMLIGSIDSMLKTVATDSSMLNELNTTQQELKTIILQNNQLLKTLYPSVMVLQMFLSSSIIVIMVNASIKMKNKLYRGNRELLEFRVSKMAILLLIMTMIGRESEYFSGQAMSLLSINVINVLINLLQVAGILAIISIVVKTSISRALKVLIYIVIAISFVLFPSLSLFLGCLDTIFNYRKVKIIV